MRQADDQDSHNDATSPLAFATVLVQQSLKTRFVSQRVPHWIYFETIDRNPARPAQQSLQNFDRVCIITQDCMNLGDRGRNFLPAKGVFAFWNASPLLRLLFQ
jgi:hypothetical protein